jgi:hypothetical protein
MQNERADSIIGSFINYKRHLKQSDKQDFVKIINFKFLKISGVVIF